MGGGQAGTRADAAAGRRRWCSPSWPGGGHTVTVRDSKRFAEPLAMPRFCPPYVRDQWTSRTQDRISWWPMLAVRTCSRYRALWGLLAGQHGINERDTG